MTKQDILDRIEDIYASSRLADIDALNKILGRKQEEKKASPVVWVFAILGALVVIAAVAYVVYRYFEPDYLEDFEDDFEDDFDDYFEDEDEVEDLLED